MFRTFWSLLRAEGVEGLYRGFSSSLVLTLNPAIQFLVFDRLKAWWLRRLAAQSPPRYEASALEIFAMGAMYVVLPDTLPADRFCFVVQRQDCGNFDHLPIYYVQDAAAA